MLSPPRRLSILASRRHLRNRLCPIVKDLEKLQNHKQFTLPYRPVSIVDFKSRNQGRWWHVHIRHPTPRVWHGTQPAKLARQTTELTGSKQQSKCGESRHRDLEPGASPLLAS